MTTNLDWKFRADFLLGQARRLELRAAECTADAEALRGLAGECDAMAIDPDRSPCHYHALINLPCPQCKPTP
jgi:hypothetical protein